MTNDTIRKVAAQGPDGLRVTMPVQVGDHAFAFKIRRDALGDAL